MRPEDIKAIETNAMIKGLVKATALIVYQFERRLDRPLRPEERACLLDRMITHSACRLANVVLDLSADEVAAWLADPNAW